MSYANSPRASLLALAAPNVTAFIASGAIMVLELVAGRLIASHLGMSLYTWTTIIGVMLGGMALGNYLGGRIADHFRPIRALAVLFALGCAGALLVLPLNTLFGNWTLLWDLAWPARISVHVTGTFLGPAILLGAITPVVAKMALNAHRNAGRAVGTVFACSVLGSILATFFTGYHLLMAQGVREITFGVALVLGLLALLYGFAAWRVTEPAPSRRAHAKSDSVLTRGRELQLLLLANATVFTTNAGFMMLELAAARLLSRAFGASLYTWTTVIGVVLLGISVGNYLGGRLADRLATPATIAAMLLLSSMATLASPALAAYAGGHMASVPFLAGLSWPMQILLYMSFAFLLPNIFIGTISPLVVKRCIDSGVAEGRAVGSVYAWGAVGAVTGTFLAGYVLIAWLWPVPVVALVALLLAAAAVCYAPRGMVTTAWALVAAVLFVAALAPAGPLERLARSVGLKPTPYGGIVYENESQYSHIAVIADADNPQRRELILDRLTHSRVDLEYPAKLDYEYEWIYEAVLEQFYGEEPIRAMVIGGGGYSFPRYLEITRPESYIEVSEIDRAVTRAAFEALGLPRDTSIEIFDMDARNRIADLIKQKWGGAEVPKFDCIFGDSINDYTVPHHLTTLEFTQQLAELLDEDGIYMLNLIDMLESGGFLAAVVNTCRQVFPFVYVLNTGRPDVMRDTFVVVSSRRPLNLTEVPDTIRARYPRYDGFLLSPTLLDDIIARHRHIVLTDNHAPVENLLAPVVRARALDSAEVQFAWARTYAQQGEYAYALQYARGALEENPGWHAPHELIAEIHALEGDAVGAIEALRKAQVNHPDPAEAHFQLGTALYNHGQEEEAVREMQQAIEHRPSHAGAHEALATIAMHAKDWPAAVRHWEGVVANRPADTDARSNLGMVHASLQDYAAAAEQWEVVFREDPENLNLLYNLALAHTSLGNYDRAWEMVHRYQADGQEMDSVLLQMLRQRSGREE